MDRLACDSSTQTDSLVSFMLIATIRPEHVSKISALGLGAILGIMFLLVEHSTALVEKSRSVGTGIPRSRWERFRKSKAGQRTNRIVSTRKFCPLVGP